jgi:CoA:oxalate CoA-transferase
VLESIRVIDLTWILGAPFATQLLAQMGAEIIKVEPPSGDQARTYPPFTADGQSAYFMSINRGKKSLALDLKKPQAREVLYDLVRGADVIMYGYTPDVPKRLGIDWETLQTINGRIVLGQLIGLHDEGPYAEVPAVDIIAQALSGIMDITGEPGGGPVRIGYQIADLAAGLFLANGVLGALIKALKTGCGSRVQMSLLDGQLALLTWQAQNHFVTGTIPQAMGSRHPSIGPSQAFRCQDGRYIAISGVSDDFFRTLCQTLKAPGLADDARFSSVQLRMENIDALAAELQCVFLTAPADQWVCALQEARLPGGKVHNVKEALEQPLAALRYMVEEVRDPVGGGTLKFLGNPIKHEGAAFLSYPPRVGQHSEEVLRETCGYDEAKIAALRASGAVA